MLCSFLAQPFKATNTWSHNHSGSFKEAFVTLIMQPIRTKVLIAKTDFFNHIQVIIFKNSKLV